MSKKFSVLLFKDSNCNLCKLMQQELMENPPAADIAIIHVDRASCSNEATLYNIEYFPTTLLLNEKGTIINRFEGFIDSKSIDTNINEYEAKHMV